MNTTRTAQVATVGMLAAVMLTGCLVSSGGPDDVPSPVESDGTAAGADSEPAPSPEESGEEEDVAATDSETAAELEVVDTSCEIEEVGGEATFEFDGCATSDTGVQVRVPSALRQAATVGTESLPINELNIKPYELESDQLCAIEVDLNYAAQPSLREGFTAEVMLPPVTEVEVWQELLAEYKQRPTPTSLKVRDKHDTSFYDFKRREGLGGDYASLAAEFEEWARVTSGYTEAQVAFHEKVPTDIEYDDATALRIAVTGAEYLDASGDPLFEETAEGGVPVVADYDLTLDALDATDPALGAYLSDRLTSFVIVTDCAADLEDDAARYPVLLPVMTEDTDEPAPFRTFAEVGVAVTADGDISVTGDTDGYARTTDGTWVAGS